MNAFRLIRLTCVMLVLGNYLISAPSIDVVYTWVDGNDPEWRALKELYLIATLRKAIADSSGDYEDSEIRRTFLATMAAMFDAATQNRFVDNQELRYSLRALYEYAPFVNHIYIVTMGQRPHWLADHPKITIIDHKQIFKNQSDLPTFNSHAIECNLHRIPGLGEYFLYFNDDVFLGAPVTPEDFFVNDKVNVLFEKGLSPAGEPEPGETSYRRACRNTNNFINAHFKVEERHRLCHMPFALRKSYIEQVEAAFPKIFASNSSHRFRSEHDYTVTNGLLQYSWVYQNRVVSRPLKSRPTSSMMVSFWPDGALEKTIKQLEKLKTNRPATFCLEDLMDGNSTQARTLMHAFLQETFPKPAPWEK